MKKIIQLLTAGIVCLGIMGGTAAAATAAPCTITNGNGTGSTNVCQFDVNNHLIFTCVNDILVVNGTTQAANSGAVQTASNTAVGSVSSGNAINAGETTTNIDAACIPAAAVTPTPAVVTPASTPAATPAAPAAAPVAVAALPKTGTSNVVSRTAMGTAIIAGLLGASQLGILAYRRLALK